ncbi:AMP-binding protein [Polaromonas sp.]|uniref:class I adenylate-forming enzyme family protein n=1 Tax=Polaromonas sp. TaxID=1869339 RepID=UPI003263808D
MIVAQLLEQAARRYADKIAIECGDTAFSYAQMWHRGLCLAATLRRNGIDAGDRVGVLCANTIPAVDAILSLAILSAVRVPLYARDSLKGHLHMLKGTGCKAVLLDDTFIALPSFHDACASSGILVVPLGLELGQEQPLAQIAHGGWDDLHAIRHTGGTTGYPMPVAYSNRQWIDAAKDWFSELPRVEVADPFLHACPVSHGSGYCFLPVWLRGGINVLMPDFDVDLTLAALLQRRNAMTFLVPTMLAALVERARELGHVTRSAKCIQVASAPVTPRTLLAACEIFGPIVHQLYGQTEALPVSILKPSDIENAKPEDAALSSVGWPLPYAVIEIRDLEHSERRLGRNEVGEVALACGAMMSGFYGAAGTNSRQRISQEFVLTGDIGLMNEHGMLTLVDRKSQMIISGGFNIFPAEIETVLLSHPDILEVAVFGVPDSKWGERPKAVCQIRKGSTVKEEDLIHLCVEELGSYRKPVAINMQYDQLTRTAVGKIDRVALRSPHWEGHQKFVHAV